MSKEEHLIKDLYFDITMAVVLGQANSVSEEINGGDLYADKQV